MIAPLRPPQEKTTRGGRQLHTAHEFLAAALLGDAAEDSKYSPSVSGLKAWAFALWTAAITAAYAAAMLGWW